MRNSLDATWALRAPCHAQSCRIMLTLLNARPLASPPPDDPLQTPKLLTCEWPSATPNPSELWMILCNPRTSECTPSASPLNARLLLPCPCTSLPPAPPLLRPPPSLFQLAPSSAPAQRSERCRHSHDVQTYNVRCQQGSRAEPGAMESAGAREAGVQSVQRARRSAMLPVANVGERRGRSGPEKVENHGGRRRAWRARRRDGHGCKMWRVGEMNVATGTSTKGRR